MVEVRGGGLMSDIFQIDNRDLKRLMKFYKSAPRKFQFSAAGVLTAQAKGTRRGSHPQYWSANGCA